MALRFYGSSGRFGWIRCVASRNLRSDLRALCVEGYDLQHSAHDSKALAHADDAQAVGFHTRGVKPFAVIGDPQLNHAVFILTTQLHFSRFRSTVLDHVHECLLSDTEETERNVGRDGGKITTAREPNVQAVGSPKIFCQAA